jgi:hypothetical protein
MLCVNQEKVWVQTTPTPHPAILFFDMSFFVIFWLYTTMLGGVFHVQINAPNKSALVGNKPPWWSS